MKFKSFTLLLTVLLMLNSCNKGVEPQTNYHNKILFTSSRNGTEQLYMMKSDASEIRQITNGPYSHGGGRWSPDAKQIVTGTSEGLTTACYSHKVLINADGTNRRVLSCGSQMAWSPDANRIAFVTYPRAEIGDVSSYVYVYDLVTSKVTRVTQGIGIFVSSPCWSADGNSIYFASNQHDPSKNNPEVYKIANDGTNLERITFTPSGYTTSPSLSPGGTLLAVVSKQDSISSPSIFVIEPNGLNLRKVVQPPSGEVFNYPRWSPDGTQLTFVSGLTDGNTKTYIYKINVDGTNLQRSIPEDSSANSPDWSR